MTSGETYSTDSSIWRPLEVQIEPLCSNCTHESSEWGEGMAELESWVIYVAMKCVARNSWERSKLLMYLNHNSNILNAGFGLLESGRVSSKDEVNIMVKNVIDVIFGGPVQYFNKLTPLHPSLQVFPIGCSASVWHSVIRGPIHSLEWASSSSILMENMRLFR